MCVYYVNEFVDCTRAARPSQVLAITFAVLVGGRNIAVARFVQITRSRVSA